MYKNKAMRLVIWMVLLGLVLSACAKPTLEPTAEPPEATPTEAPAEEPTQEAPIETEEVSEEPMACPASTVADSMDLDGGIGHQFELAEYEELAGCKMTFSDNPYFADQDLPPVEERLPEEPLVVQPYDEIGTYGGTLRGTSVAAESGTTEIQSWRQAQMVRLADDMQRLVPDVAKAWEWNDDFTEITFFLRKGMKWSDGEPFTTDDVLFWWEDLVLNEEFSVSGTGIYEPGGEWAKVEKIDDLTVKFTFAVPNPSFLIYLATKAYNPYAPKHFLKQFHIDYNPDANELAQAEGYDDWTVLMSQYWHGWQDAWRRARTPVVDSHMLVKDPNSEERVYVANPYYWKVDTAGQQLPYITHQHEAFISDREVFTLMIINGEVDQKAQNLALWDYPLLKENEEKSGYTIQMASGGSTESPLFWFNRTIEDPVLRAIFNDDRFSQAMSLAINRQEIIDVVYLGLGRPYSGVPDTTSSFIELWMTEYMTEYDPDQANELLDEMGLERGADGWRLRPDGKPLIINFEFYQQSYPVQVNPLVKEYWEAVGVQARLKEVTTEAARARRSSNEHEVDTGSNSECFEMGFISDPTVLYPPFEDAMGIPWADWYQTDGASGEEPPDYAKRLFELAEQWRLVEPLSDEYDAIAKEMIQIHLDHMLAIGIVGEQPAPTVVSNRLGNVPEWPVQNSSVFRARAMSAWQWYFRE